MPYMKKGKKDDTLHDKTTIYGYNMSCNILISKYIASSRYINRVRIRNFKATDWSGLEMLYNLLETWQREYTCKIDFFFVVILYLILQDEVNLWIKYSFLLVVTTTKNFDEPFIQLKQKSVKTCKIQ